MDISKVTMCNFIFGECSLLQSLPDISKWNICKIKSLIGLFCKCTSLITLPDITNWNTSNVLSLSYLFYECSSLKELPDLSKWNMENIIDLNCLFFNCSSLISLPDISKWNIFNSDINNYISYLDSLFDSNNNEAIKKAIEILSHIEKYNESDLYFKQINFTIPERKSYTKEEIMEAYLDDAYNMRFLFAGCSSLKELPDISKWNLSNAINIRGLFIWQ